MKWVLFAMMIAFNLIIAPAFAQLAPKGATNLKSVDISRVNVGQPAPDFTLENYDGNKITLSEFRGKKNVVLVFYRGHW